MLVYQRVLSPMFGNGSIIAHPQCLPFCVVSSFSCHDTMFVCSYLFVNYSDGFLLSSNPQKPMVNIEMEPGILCNQ